MHQSTDEEKTEESGFVLFTWMDCAENWGTKMGKELRY
jgi:hypothetical protein